MRERFLQKITKYDKVIRKAIEILGVLLLAMLILWLICKLVSELGLNIDYSWGQTIALLYKKSVISLCALFLLCMVLRLCMSPFFKSDEEEDFETKANYFLRKQEENEMFRSLKENNYRLEQEKIPYEYVSSRIPE